VIVPSKKPKSDDKVKQQGEKEVEINAELATNEEITKKAETIEGVSAPTIQEQEQEAIETELDKTKKSIKKTHSKIS
jgi:vacuolar-type H+-ATPase subunit D/Vma8